VPADPSLVRLSLARRTVFRRRAEIACDMFWQLKISALVKSADKCERQPDQVGK
jgi:hypothetical protein